jgi:predicted unusual protein kinase regulating ubiquinone biosynthesis (AarF/ABC1/UbiB family)
MLTIKKIYQTSKFAFDCRYSYQHLPNSKKVAWIKDNVQKLGTTYIKLGQFLANRPDAIQGDPHIIQALSQLHDNVEPMPWDDVNKIINDGKYGIDLGAFESIDTTPLAAASIGQVHRACLKDGSTVVIKIRRPDVAIEVKNDIEILLFLCKCISYFSKETSQFADAIKILRDMEASIIRETDMDLEIKNIEMFREKVKNYKIPRVYKELSTRNVLVMEYVMGVKFRDAYAPGDFDNRKKLAYKIMDAFIQQFLFYGVIHGDPHPGNIALLQCKTNFVMYDFGHVVSLDKQTRNYMKLLVFELINENIPGVINILSEVPDLVEMRQGEHVSQYIRNYIKYIKSIDVKVLQNMADNNSNIPFKFSGKVFEIIRIFGIVEGICLELDADFSYETVFEKYIDKIFTDAEFLMLKAFLDSKLFIDKYM